jgi:hypothetical protein
MYTALRAVIREEGPFPPSTGRPVLGNFLRWALSAEAHDIFDPTRGGKMIGRSRFHFCISLSAEARHNIFDPMRGGKKIGFLRLHSKAGARPQPGLVRSRFVRHHQRPATSDEEDADSRERERSTPTTTSIVGLPRQSVQRQPPRRSRFIRHHWRQEGRQLEI